MVEENRNRLSHIIITIKKMREKRPIMNDFVASSNRRSDFVL